MNELEYEKAYHDAYSSFIRMMDKELDNAGCKYAEQYTNRVLSEKEKEKGQYPFQEGDDYWTIEKGRVVWSCWDDISEQMHDENPNKAYYKSQREAVKQLNKKS
tara:strand:- start:419 stop:730 length:312 start_codon:yes stop_codon:yes gene_type:complete